jgi:hypothetical protein
LTPGQVIAALMALEEVLMNNILSDAEQDALIVAVTKTILSKR